MDRYEYDITRHASDTFDKVVYFCSRSGQCGIEEIAKDQTRVLADILNHRGKEGWELVQVAFGKDGLMAYWKRKLLE